VRNTWAGELPKGWRSTSLKWLADIFTGGTPEKENAEYWRGGDVPWLNSGAVNDWVISEPSAYITRLGLAHSSARLISRGSVLVALAGQGRTKGMSARLEIESSCNQSMAAIVPGSELNYRYLHYWLSANYKSVRSLGGGDLRDGLNLQHVGGIDTPVPVLQEQHRIADFLDERVSRIDNIIAARNHQIDGLSGEYRSWQAEAFDAAERGNGSTTLRRFMISIEQGWSPQCASVPAEPGEHGVIKLGAVRSGDFRADENKAMSPGDEPDLRYRLNEGDLLVTRANTPTYVGDAAVVTGLGAVPLYLPDLVYRIRIVGSPQFLSFALRSPQNRQLVATLARGTSQTMVKLRGEDVADFRVPALNADAQEALGVEDSRNRADVAAKVGQMQNANGLLTEYKQSLITAAVTGQFDVTTAVTEVPA
jgi:type I restriction enzyme S subunit